MLYTKLASSTLSPASARDKRIPSAENCSMPSVNVKKFPVLLDIFSLLIMRCPLARILLGHISGWSFHIATWLKSKYVRWFWTKSFPEALMSIGYLKLAVANKMKIELTSRGILFLIRQELFGRQAFYLSHSQLQWRCNSTRRQSAAPVWFWLVPQQIHQMHHLEACGRPCNKHCK